MCSMRSLAIFIFIPVGFYCSVCSARIGPKLHPRQMKEHFGRTTDPQQHMDTMLRSEFQAHLNYNTRLMQETLTKMTGDLRNQLDLELQSMKQICNIDQEDSLAFQGRLSVWQRGQDMHLTTDEVTLNIGGVYDASTARITAPIAGVYRLTISGHKVQESNVSMTCTRFSINEKTSSEWCAEWVGEAPLVQLVELKAGDVVSVEFNQNVTHPSESTENGKELMMEITFSGYLLAKLGEE